MPELFWRAAERLAEATVALSYGAPGIAIRRRGRFDAAALDVDMTDRVVVVTGANAGLGRAAAEVIAKRGATTVLVCRNETRGQRARREIVAAAGHDRVELELCDLSDLEQVAALTERIAARHPAVDVLINNAGVLLDERKVSAQGFELAFATNVLAGFLLTQRLRPQLRAAAPARVIHVTSGGMYTARLDVDDLQSEQGKYDGVRAYAQHKRAQVILSEMWAQRLAGDDVSSNAMHPGWAATPGVAKSLPKFNRLMGPILRDAEQGADTIVWLAVSREAGNHTGQFWFDRAPRSTHRNDKTKSTSAEREQLWAACTSMCAPWWTP